MPLDFDTVFQRIASPAREHFIEFVEDKRDSFSRWPSDVSYIYLAQDKRYIRAPDRTDIFNSSLMEMVYAAYRALPTLSDEEINEEFNKIPDAVFQRLCVMNRIQVQWLHFRTQDLKVIDEGITSDALSYAFSYIISISSVRHLAILVDEIHTNWLNKNLYSFNDLFQVAEASVNDYPNYPLAWILEVVSSPILPIESK